MAKGRVAKKRTKQGGVRWTIPPVEQVRVRPSWWTVERGLYALLGLIALFVRALWLDTRPLSPPESHLAWLAWHNTQPLPHLSVNGVSPLAYALEWLLFLVAGGNDALARLWPMLAGTLLVLLPYSIKEVIGRERALLVALLLALSPQAVYWSRHASGVSLGMSASLLLTVLVVLWLIPDGNGQYPDRETTASPTWVRERGRHLLWVGVALALLLTSHALAYTVLLGLAAGLWGWKDRLGRMWHDVGGSGRHRAAGAFLLTAITIGSVFWLDIPALGNVPDLLGTWLAGFWRNSGYPWYWVPFRLAADEPLLTGFALRGAFRAWRRRDGVDVIWLAWAIVAFLLGFRPGRSSADVGFLVIPLAFLAADGLWEAIQRLRRPTPTWREELVLTAAFLVILGFWFMMIVGYLRVGDSRYIPAIIIVPALLVGLVILYSFWLGREASWRVAVTILIITGLTWGGMALWVQNLHLAEDAALDALPGIERVMTHPNVRMLVRTLERISAEKQTDWHEIPLDILVMPTNNDVLRWYLRDFKNMQEVSSVKAINSPVALAPPGAGEIAGYTGMDWIITTSQLPTELGGRIYHWWFYREAPLSDQRQEVVLWFKRSQ